MSLLITLKILPFLLYFIKLMPLAEHSINHEKIYMIEDSCSARVLLISNKLIILPKNSLIIRYDSKNPRIELSNPPQVFIPINSKLKTNEKDILPPINNFSTSYDSTFDRLCQ